MLIHWSCTIFAAEASRWNARLRHVTRSAAPQKGPRLQPVFAEHPSRRRYDSTSQYSTRWRCLAHLLTNSKEVIPASEIPSKRRGSRRLRYNRAFHRTLLPYNATGAPYSQGMLEILTSVSWRPEWTRMKKKFRSTWRARIARTWKISQNSEYYYG